nr:MAG TPA: hypothetical protein [Caudoviricetes sp.]DAP18238.1 MAG TPA: hypothetical protein [Caudoviricetes sp.]DAT40678.1 MAG TPA: hypothetical protein [Caudoviricetes sp.]
MGLLFCPDFGLGFAKKTWCIMREIICPVFNCFWQFSRHIVFCFAKEKALWQKKANFRRVSLMI